MQSPFKAFRITSPFGPRKDPITGSSNTHKGADIVPTDGDWNIRPMLPGVVKPTQYSTVWGNSILIDHSGGVLSFYAHCAKIYVQAGDTVQEDTTIAYMGNTGRSTGAHLHFGVQIDGVWIDPVEYAKERMSLEKVKVTEDGQSFSAYRIDGKTFVELRAYVQADGKDVAWDEATKTATVTGGLIQAWEEFLENYRGGAK